MTKHEFCRQIVQTVDNCRSLDKMTDDEIAVAIGSLISPLAPKDLKRYQQQQQQQGGFAPQQGNNPPF